MNIWTHKFTLNSKNAQFLMALTQNVLQGFKDLLSMTLEC